MKKIQKVLKEQKGFTLVELVVVIAILGILIAIAVPKFTDITGNAQTKAQQATARTIMSAIVMAQAENPDIEPGAITAKMVNEFLEDLEVEQSDKPGDGKWGYKYEETEKKWKFYYGAKEITFK